MRKLDSLLGSVARPLCCLYRLVVPSAFSRGLSECVAASVKKTLHQVDVVADDVLAS